MCIVQKKLLFSFGWWRLMKKIIFSSTKLLKLTDGVQQFSVLLLYRSTSLSRALTASLWTDYCRGSVLFMRRLNDKKKFSSCSGTQEDSRGLWHGPGFPSVPGPAGLHARACIPRWERPDLLPGAPDGGAAQYDQWVSGCNSYCSSLRLCAYVEVLKSNFGTGMEKCIKGRYQIEFLLLRNIDRCFSHVSRIVMSDGQLNVIDLWRI